jgi:hypothetical protein
MTIRSRPRYIVGTKFDAPYRALLVKLEWRLPKLSKEPVSWRSIQHMLDVLIALEENFLGHHIDYDTLISIRLSRLSCFFAPCCVVCFLNPIRCYILWTWSRLFKRLHLHARPCEAIFDSSDYTCVLASASLTRLLSLRMFLTISLYI